MNIDELLGIDLNQPGQRLADELVREDEKMLDELVRIRKSSPLTQADVAHRMGISQSAVARIESGERDPHLSTLRRYAHAVGALVEHRVIEEKTLSRHWDANETQDLKETYSEALVANALRKALLHT